MKQYLTASTSVWWDVDCFPIPEGLDPCLIARNIKSVLTEMGYTGEVTIFAYGNIRRIHSSVQEAFDSAGIDFDHITYDTEGSARLNDSKITKNMLVWACENSIPANYLIILGDRERFSFAIKQLHRMAYNILLEPPPNGYSLQSLLSGRCPALEALSSSSASTSQPSDSSGNQSVCGNGRNHLVSVIKRSGAYEGMVYWMAKISVWWDVDNCPIPSKCDPRLIARNIKLALAEEGYKGDVTISAYANAEVISDSDLQALKNSGITVHNSAGGKADIKSDIMAWMQENRPPANYLLISDKFKEFSLGFEPTRSCGFNNLMLPSDNKHSQTLLS